MEPGAITAGGVVVDDWARDTAGGIAAAAHAATDAANTLARRVRKLARLEAGSGWRDMVPESRHGDSVNSTAGEGRATDAGIGGGCE